MDTSEQNIKMCDCEEIQRGWEPSVGDWFLHDWHGTTKMGKELEDKVWPEKEKWERIECLTYKPSIDDYIEVSESDGSHGVYTSSRLLKDSHIWLPRQDQLQEMVGGNCWEVWQRLNDYLLWQYWSNKVALSSWASWEQLWLAFVMKVKYGKMWDGETWLKQ